MAESYLGLIRTDNHNFLQTSALYAVRSEISRRGIPPQIKKQGNTEYIQVEKLKIFVGYCVQNEESTQQKTFTVPYGKHHSFVIRLRYGVEQGFLILTPEWIQKLCKDQYIDKHNDSYFLNCTFLPNKDIFLKNTIKLNRFLERRQSFLDPYISYPYDH